MLRHHIKIIMSIRINVDALTKEKKLNAFVKLYHELNNLDIARAKVSNNFWAAVNCKGQMMIAFMIFQFNYINTTCK